MPGCQICFLTTVHCAGDNRICQKEARALADAGYRVTVIGLPDDRDAAPPGVALEFLPPQRGRLRRFLGLPGALRRAVRTGARVVAIHDPELLPVAALLHALWRRRVVYDVHEDVPAQIATKEWLPRRARPTVAALYRAVERLLLRCVDAVVLAERSYESAYRGRRQLTILNYPRTRDLVPRAPAPEPLVVYLGTITERRGLFRMLEVARRVVAEMPEARFRLIGPLAVPAEARAARAFVERHGLGAHVEFTGRLTPPQARAAIAGARVGLVLLAPDPNYVRSLPTKLFEYMLAGVPVVCAHVPLWRDIVEGAGCGAVVDPEDGPAAAAAVLELLRQSDGGQQLGERGRAAVIAHYGWEPQEPRLVELYRELAGPPAGASTSS